MALTLLECCKLEKDTLHRNILEAMVTASPLLQYLPFSCVGVLNYPHAKSVEDLKIFGGKSQVSRAACLEQSRTPSELRAVRDRVKAKQVALTFTKQFFNGDALQNYREINGLNIRLPESQILYLDLTEDALNQVIDKVSGTPDVLFMSKDARRKIMLWNSKHVGQVWDFLDHSILSYRGIPIQVFEEEILSSEIYAIDFKGESEPVLGIQKDPIMVLDMDLQFDLNYLTVIEWLASFVLNQAKSVAKLAITP